MPACRDCHYFRTTKDGRGDCEINGPTQPDRDAQRCPSRTFRPKSP